jgi:hypothetical protein
MRAKFSYVLPGVLYLLFAVALTASAQDDVPGPSNTNSNLFSQDPAIYDEKPLIFEQGEKGVKFVVSDSLSHKIVPAPAAKQKANDAKKAQAEGDPLNFNFLYYIIQKFKSSELMME